ncbi:IL16 [Cordylochernes scorpioides]|uniref:IL16 n=1 Tax=Cordylochernes scorpioides TaxID=51811 RepID=A0ABY6KYS5_9ARAC|nr:IL16 [Cordylochernes scorpioides]
MELPCEEEYGPCCARLPPDGHEVPLSYFDPHPGATCPPILASKISSSSSSCEDSGVFFEDTEPKILAEKCKAASRYVNLRSKEYSEENGNPYFDSADELESISSVNSHSTYSAMDKSKRAPVTEDMALMLSQDCAKTVEEPRQHSRLPPAPSRDRSIYSSSGYSKNSSNLTFKEKLAMFTKAEQEGKKNSTSFTPHSMKHAVSSDNLFKCNTDLRPICPHPSFYENKWVSTTNVFATSTTMSESRTIVNSSACPESPILEQPSPEVPPVIPRKHSVESMYPQSQLMGFKRYSLSSLGTVKSGEDYFKKSTSSIFESKSSSVSKFKGLVIPNKISQNNILGKSLPTLVGPDPSTVAKSQPIKLQPRYQTSMLSSPQETLHQENGLNMHSLLSEPPWKGGTHSLPKYSPAFKRRTLELPKARSPTPPLSPQSPTPSSPSSACSSNASSTTKPNMFHFSLTHSKPVVPLLPEKPNMSPPSISSETDTVGSISPELNTPIIPSKKCEVPQPPPLPAKRPPPPLPAKPSLDRSKQVEKPQAPPRTVSLPNGVVSEFEGKPVSDNSPICEDAEVNRSEMVDKVAEIIGLSIDNLPKRPSLPPPSVDQNSTAMARLDLLIGSPPLQIEREKSEEPNADPVVMENNLPSINDDEDIKNQHNLQLQNHYESLNKSTPIIDNIESTKLIKELSLEKQDYWSDINKRAPSSKHDSDDDAYSSVSQKTDDSRNTMDDSCSDLTCDSCELKPKKLSQQKTVLKTYIENTDSAKNFKALAERWEQRSGDSGTETPVQPPSPPAVPPPYKKESYKPAYKDITARIPHMLMPRVVEENSVDSSRSPPRDTYQTSRRSVDHYIETRNFRQSLEYLGPPRAKVIASSKSVSDICKAFESQVQNTSTVVIKTPQWQQQQHHNLVRHQRMSSVDSTASESSSTPAHYGSMGSLASSCSLQEDEAEITVVIRREGDCGGSAGIALAGGADCEVKDITVHRVIVGSPADRDGRVRRGDRLLSINGRSLRGVSHRHALELLKSPRQELVLVLARNSTLDAASITDESPVAGEKGPTQLVTLIKDGAGLGFIIEGGKDSPLGDRPICIKRIFKLNTVHLGISPSKNPLVTSCTSNGLRHRL